MPLKEIQEYMNLVNEQKFESCYAILDEHKRKIQSQIEEMNATMEKITYKLDNFNRLKNTLDWDELKHRIESIGLKADH